LGITTLMPEAAIFQLEINYLWCNIILTLRR
jgi:hypothetical protein